MVFGVASRAVGGAGVVGCLGLHHSRTNILFWVFVPKSHSAALRPIT